MLWHVAFGCVARELQAGFGGALALVSVRDGPTSSGGAFVNCTSPAAYVPLDNTLFVVVSDAVMQDNLAVLGGGVYFWRGGRLLLQNSTIQGNSALTSGGGVYAAPMTAVSSTFSSCGLELSWSTLSMNSATLEGAQLYSSCRGSHQVTTSMVNMSSNGSQVRRGSQR